MNFSLLTLSMTCIVTLTRGHLCLISPPQRGSMVGLNKPEAEDCLLLTEPCGGREEQMESLVTLKSGQRFVLTFQKNLDHTYQHKPGYFIVRMFPAEKPEDAVFILGLADTTEDSLHLYTENITIPQNLSGHVVLQVQYHTLNPNRGPVFYQCADVDIRPKDN